MLVFCPHLKFFSDTLFVKIERSLILLKEWGRTENILRKMVCLLGWIFLLLFIEQVLWSRIVGLVFEI